MCTYRTIGDWRSAKLAYLEEESCYWIDITSLGVTDRLGKTGSFRRGVVVNL